MLDGSRVYPGVKNGDVEVVFLESLDNVNDLGVAHIGAVLLECETEDYDVAAKNLYALFEHEFDNTIGNVSAHSVINASSGKDNFRIIAVALGALDQIIWVDSDGVVDLFPVRMCGTGLRHRS